jgi:hypothetical protein
VWLSGRQVQRCRDGNATERAAAAHYLTGGTIERVSQQQAAKLLGVAPSYVVAFGKLTSAQRAAVLDGSLKLFDFVSKRQTIRDVVRSHPIEAMQALDEITRPVAEAAE